MFAFICGGYHPWDKFGVITCDEKESPLVCDRIWFLSNELGVFYMDRKHPTLNLDKNHIQPQTMGDCIFMWNGGGWHEACSFF